MFRKKYILIYIFWLIVSVCLVKPNFANAQEQKIFANLNEVLIFAKDKNYLFYNASLQTKLAELTQKTAIGNVINPRIPTSFQLINNLKQQVIFLPGEVFGQPGTFKEITTAQQYSSLLNFQPQFEILNLAGLAQIKSAKINQQLVGIQNKINEQSVYDQINALYFNILSYQGQIEIIKKNREAAQTILKITQNRLKENVGRKQEVNEAEVNLITLENNLEQLELNLKIQQESLTLFFENSTYPTLSETVWNYQDSPENLQTDNMLQVENADLQLKMMKQDIKVAKAQQWPTLSFISSLSWQNLSNDFFYSASSNFVNYNYIGLRLIMDLPTTVTKLSNIKNKEYQSRILKTTAEHTIKEVETQNRQMVLDYVKALNQLKNFKKIVLLKEDSYNKNFNQYQENILSLDDLLISYNNMLAAQLNVVTALSNVGFYKSKIEINNKF